MGGTLIRPGALIRENTVVLIPSMILPFVSCILTVAVLFLLWLLHNSKNKTENILSKQILHIALWIINKSSQ